MLAAEAPLQNEGAPQTSEGSRVRSACRFAVSVTASAGLSWGLARMLRRPLEVRTDIVGYPIFANFNVFNYFTQYYVAILCFPLLSLLLYDLIGRVWRRSDWPGSSNASAELERPRLVCWLIGTLPSLALGACLGTAWLLSSESLAEKDLLVPVITSVLYAGSVGAVALLVGRRRAPERTRVVPLINVAVAPFTLLLLEGISRETWVAVQHPPSVEHYAPFPRGLVLALLGIGLVWTAVRLLRARAESEVRRLQAQSVLLFVIPVLLVCYTASIPRPLETLDYFHHGELVGGSQLVAHGLFPWRDVVFIHGLLQDVFVPWLGLRTFGWTVWGAVAGFDFWAAPVWWLAYYALFVYLFRRRPLLLLGALAVPFVGAYLLVHHRLALLPLILLALAAVLRKPGWLQASGLAAALLVANLLAPELAYAVLATGVVLLCYEWSRKERGARVRDRLVGTGRVAVAGAVLALIWCAFLQRHGALGAFVDYYRTFGSGHQLTGGIPIVGSSYADPYFIKLMLLPPTTVVLVFWYVVSRWRQRLPLEERDWVIIALTLVTAAYYTKFLSRADWHVAHAAAAALPLVFYLADRGLDAVEGLVPRGGRPWAQVTGALAILGVVIHSSPPGFLSWQGQLGRHFHFTVPGRPEIAEFGWSDRALQPLMDQVSTLKTFVQREMRGDEPIFDFTNQPALYHFLLDLKPASRFFHVSMAIRRRSQDQLIQDLERNRPRLIVYQTDQGGLPEWDGISNAVRHYEVSKWILDRYVPWAKIAGQTLYVARERQPGSSGSTSSLPPGTEGTLQRCEWGFAPFHLNTEELEVGPEARITSRETAVRLEASGWAALSSGAGPAREIVAVSGGGVLSRSPTGDYRADVAQRIASAAGNSGFRIFAEWKSPGPAEPEVRILAVGERGEAGELYVQGSRAGVQDLPAQLGDLRVVHGSVLGNVERFELSKESIVQVQFPPEALVSTLAGVELEARASRTGAIAISAVSPEGVSKRRTGAMEARGVVVRVPRTTDVRIRVPADNCPSWRSNGTSTLFIRSDDGVEVRSVRALRRLR